MATAAARQNRKRVSVGEDEVKAVLDRMNAAKGTRNIASARSSCPPTRDNEAQTIDNANKILDQLKNGASFAGYARQYSEASTAAVGGDLGWVRPEQLPPPLAAVVREMGPARSATRSRSRAACRSSRSRTPARS